MAGNSTFDYSVILFREGDVWIAHCLEVDIVSQGKTIDLAKESFKRTIVCQIMIDLANNRSPLAGWDKAPKEIWDLFEKFKNNGTWSREPLYLPDVPINATINEYSIAA